MENQKDIKQADKVVTNCEYHINGQLAYTETIKYISKEDINAYSNVRTSSDGSLYWYRIGKQAKYYDNGQLAWELNYDEKDGSIIKDNKPSYRKDGTVIVY